MKKIFVVVMILSIALFLVSCDKNNEIAQSYANKYAKTVRSYKIDNEYYQPTEDDILELIKSENLDESNINELKVVKIEDGKIYISVNGRVASAPYQTLSEFNKEKEEINKLSERGPIIKGFFLGMPKDSVVSVINYTFPENDAQKYKFSDFKDVTSKYGTPSGYFDFVFKRDKSAGVKNWIYYVDKEVDELLMFAGGYSYFLFDTNSNLYGFQLGKDDVKLLFNSGDMSLQKFSQHFVDYYSFITNLKPNDAVINNEIKMNPYMSCRIYGSQHGYKFESDFGWELQIFYTENIDYYFGGMKERIYDYAGSEAVSIRLMKTKSIEEAVFGD